MPMKHTSSRSRYTGLQGGGRAKVVVVVHGLQAGGTERVSIALTRWIHERAADFAALLVTLDPADADFYDASSIRRRIAWPEGRSSRSRLRSILRVRRILREEQPACVVAMGTFAAVTTLAASVGAPWKVFVSERNDPSKAVSVPLRTGRLLLYRRSFVGVALTDYGARWLQRLMPQSPVHVIPNAVDMRYFSATEPGSIRRKTILSVGRLHDQKGHDVLIRAFASVPKQERHGWTLRIVGEGDERAFLEALARELGCEDDVEFPGNCKNILSEYHKAGVFAMASRYEGFPNALLEAMATGLPVVVSDIPSIRAVLSGGQAGLLFSEGSHIMAGQALVQVMADENLRDQHGQRSRSAARQFCPQDVYGRWLMLLRGAVSNC